MSAIKLKSLTMKSFRSFKDETTIVFPKDGILCVSGKSGVGKTNINLAISFALGYCPLPGTVLQCWDSEEPMSVSLTLETGEGDAVITRSAKSVSLVVAGKKHTSATGVDERLRQLFSGVQTEMLEKLVYRPQKSRGRFLSMDDTEKKEFLGGLLSLQKFEDQIEVSANKIRDLEQQAMMSSYSLNGLLQRWQAALAEVGEPPTPPSDDGAKERIQKLQEEVAAAKERVAVLSIESAAVGAKANKQVEDFEQSAMAKSIALKQRPRPVVEKPVHDFSEADAVLAKVTLVKERVARLETEDAEANRLRIAKKQTLVKVRAALLDKAGMAFSMRARAETAVAKLDGMLKSKCYTCGQPWNAEGGIDDARAEVDKLNAAIEAIDKECAETPDMDVEIESLQATIVNPNKAKLAEVANKLSTDEKLLREKERQRVAGLEKELRGVVAKHDQEYTTAYTEARLAIEVFKQDIYKGVFAARERVSLAEAALSRLSRELESEQSVLKMSALTFKHLVDKYQVALSQSTAAQRSYESANVTNDKANEALSVEKDVQATLKGFLNSIFEEVLSEIADSANKILVSIPNVSKCTVEFKTETATKKGTIKKAIVPVVTVDGHETPVKHGLSGGMESAVELAIDLAVTAVVQARTGVCPQWLVLDEAFDGFSGEVKESCLEVLKEYANDKLVIFNSHSPEFKEYFGSVITIENDGGSSYVTESGSGSPS